MNGRWLFHMYLRSTYTYTLTTRRFMPPFLPWYVCMIYKCYIYACIIGLQLFIPSIFHVI